MQRLTYLPHGVISYLTDQFVSLHNTAQPHSVSKKNIGVGLTLPITLFAILGKARPASSMQLLTLLQVARNVQSSS